MEQTPTSDKPADIVAELLRLRRIGQMTRDNMERTWEVSNKLVEGAKHREYVGGGATKGNFQPVVNRIANSVNIKYAALTEMQERPVILPRGGDAPASVYLSFSGKAKAASLGVEVAETITEAELKKLLALTDPEADRKMKQQAQELQDEIASLNEQGTAAQAQGQDSSQIQQQLQQVGAAQQQLMQQSVPMLFAEEEDFIRVTDDFAADAMTVEVQNQWIRCKADIVMGKHKYQKIVIGHSDQMLQWDAAKQNYELIKLDPYNVWIDPLAINCFDAQFVIVRQVIPVSKAKKMWPQHADEIDEKKQSIGSSVWKAGFGKLGDAIQYGSDAEVVERITAFLRDSDWAENPPAEDGSHAGHPAGTGLRQVELIGDIVLFDGPCFFPDIPVSRDINIPRSSTNYGVGDPEYLWDLQNIYHRLMSIVYENALYSRAAMHLVPVSVLDQIRTYLEEAYTMAGQFLPISDEQYMIHQGKPITQLDPPQLSPIIFKTLEMISQEIDRLSGAADVMRGEAGANWSGAIFEQATNNARSPIGMTARHTVQHVKYLINIAMKVMLAEMSAETLYERNRAYPVEVWECIKDRLSTIDYDFEVQVSGTQKKSADAQKMVEAAHNQPALWTVPGWVKQLAHKSDWQDADKIAEEVSAAMSQSQQKPK